MQYKVNKFKNIAILALINSLFVPVFVLQAQSGLQILELQDEVVDGTKARISWQTSVNSTGRIDYGFSSGAFNAYVEDNSSQRNHAIMLSNLEDNTRYYYQLTAKNSSGEIVKSFIQSFRTDDLVDKTSPTLTNIDIPYVAGTLAVITWNTNEPATTYLEYGPYESYGQSVHSTKKKTEHQVVLRDLLPSRKYSVRFNSVDKDGNRSGTHYRSFNTLSSSVMDSKALKIDDLRPNSASDPNVKDTSITVSFRTNHWAKGSVNLSGSGRNVTQNLDYGKEHAAVFEKLPPDSAFALKINMSDVYGKNIEKKLNVGTRPLAPSSGSGDSGGSGDTGSSAVNPNIDYGLIATADAGFFGRYYNITADNDTSLNKPNSPFVTDWYQEDNLYMTRIEEDLLFDCPSFGLPGDLTGGRGFTAHWSGSFTVPQTGTYTYNVKSDDDSWVYIDGKQTTNLGGLHKARYQPETVDLSAGSHTLDIFYAERKSNWGCFGFTMPEISLFRPSAGAYGSGTGAGGPDAGGTGSGSSGSGSSGQSDAGGGVIVAGAEFSLYTVNSGLYKTPASPDVYTIMNGQSHYISSPSSFIEYGYDWNNIKTFSREQAEHYPRARLIKSPDNSTIYYLYQRPENKWLKIDLPSPTVFISYPDNYWGNVLTVTQLDVDSYPYAHLIRLRGSNEVYYLENGVKHLVSPAVFTARGFNPHLVVEVKQVHFDAYSTGGALRVD